MLWRKSIITGGIGTAIDITTDRIMAMATADITTDRIMAMDTAGPIMAMGTVGTLSSAVTRHQLSLLHSLLVAAKEPKKI